MALAVPLALDHLGTTRMPTQSFLFVAIGIVWNGSCCSSDGFRSSHGKANRLCRIDWPWVCHYLHRHCYLGRWRHWCYWLLVLGRCNGDVWNRYHHCFLCMVNVVMNIFVYPWHNDWHFIFWINFGMMGMYL